MYPAAVLTAPGRIELEQRTPPALEPSQALVRVHAAGVCGTDLAIHDGGYEVPLPLVLGHEWVGTVAAVGDEADRDWVGRRVVGEINQHCLAMRWEPPCEACGAGLPTHCLKRMVTGIAGQDGAFAGCTIIATANLREVPDAMADEAAILIEPLAAALQTFALTPLEAGGNVVVLGCGRLGVLIAAVAQEKGGRVFAFAQHAEHGELAARLGVEAKAVDAPDQIVSAVRDATNGLGADVVVEATGSPDGLALALDCVRPRGTIALKSTPGVAVERFDLTRTVVNEVRLQGSRCGDFDKAIAFWKRSRLPLERLVVAEFSLDRIADAMARAHQPGKVLVRCARR
jgi:threonine dehydrogenase-like Zn-dependent dehydrogenase